MTPGFLDDVRERFSGTLAKLKAFVAYFQLPPGKKTPYPAATRHPWVCFLFLLPLLIVYEGGVLWLGGTNPEMLRNGADHWLRWGLETFGLQRMYWPPVLIVLSLLLCSWVRRHDRPDDLVGVCTGMALESIGCALGLWAVSRGLGPLLDSLDIVLNTQGSLDETVAQLITFVGAGIYEEVLFRLLLYWGLVWLLRQAELPGPLARVLAVLAASLTFAAAHHFGPYGEAYDPYVFLFRSLAGIYFTLIYLLRGFGVAVGTHACYDVLVGVAVG